MFLQAQHLQTSTAISPIGAGPFTGACQARGKATCALVGIEPRRGVTAHSANKTGQ